MGARPTGLACILRSYTKADGSIGQSRQSDLERSQSIYCQSTSTAASARWRYGSYIVKSSGVCASSVPAPERPDRNAKSMASQQLLLTRVIITATVSFYHAITQPNLKVLQKCLIARTWCILEALYLLCRASVSSQLLKQYCPDIVDCGFLQRLPPCIAEGCALSPKNCCDSGQLAIRTCLRILNRLRRSHILNGLACPTKIATRCSSTRLAETQL